MGSVGSVGSTGAVRRIKRGSAAKFQNIGNTDNDLINVSLVFKSPVTSHSRFFIIKKRPFGLFLFCHSLRKKLTDSFCGHIITVVEKPFGAFDDEPIHQVLCNEVIGGRKEGKACLVMLFFRDEAGKSGRF